MLIDYMAKARKLEDQRIKAVLLVRAEVLRTARQWLNSEGFIEVQGPIIVPLVGETSSFKVDFFGKPACLSGGLQPYSDFFSSMLGKVYTIMPAFREERNQSERHLVEFWRIETSALNQDFEDMLACQERMVTYICNHLQKQVPEELSFLSNDIEDIKQVHTPFLRITYDEAVDRLQEIGQRISWGQDLDWNSQRKLSLMFNQPFFITEFPINADTITQKSPPMKPHLTMSADLFAPKGYGEISSGGESINDKKVLLERLSGADIEPVDRLWYLSLRQWSKSPNSGFALGVERLLMWICDLKSVRQANAFSRSFGNQVI